MIIKINTELLVLFSVKMTCKKCLPAVGGRPSSAESTDFLASWTRG